MWLLCVGCTMCVFAAGGDKGLFVDVEGCINFGGPDAVNRLSRPPMIHKQTTEGLGLASKLGEVQAQASAQNGPTPATKR